MSRYYFLAFSLDYITGLNRPPVCRMAVVCVGSGKGHRTVEMEVDGEGQRRRQSYDVWTQVRLHATEEQVCLLLFLY